MDFSKSCLFHLTVSDNPPPPPSQSVTLPPSSSTSTQPTGILTPECIPSGCHLLFWISGFDEDSDVVYTLSSLTLSSLILCIGRLKILGNQCRHEFSLMGWRETWKPNPQVLHDNIEADESDESPPPSVWRDGERNGNRSGRNSLMHITNYSCRMFFAPPAAYVSIRQHTAPYADSAGTRQGEGAVRSHFFGRGGREAERVGSSRGFLPFPFLLTSSSLSFFCWLFFLVPKKNNALEKFSV